ncbi:hypothetical protein F5Y06DRAFT_245940 [Hypoxylon sp. FL0890]|nr:hypothetical protein F5Y06DRAFT_245940 [Hypoxylon sp. FL0890]
MMYPYAHYCEDAINKAFWRHSLFEQANLHTITITARAEAFAIEHGICKELMFDFFYPIDRAISRLNVRYVRVVVIDLDDNEFEHVVDLTSTTWERTEQSKKDLEKDCEGARQQFLAHAALGMKNLSFFSSRIAKLVVSGVEVANRKRPYWKLLGSCRWRGRLRDAVSLPDCCEEDIRAIESKSEDDRYQNRVINTAINTAINLSLSVAYRSDYARR